MGKVARRSYPHDVTDEEWAFALPYLLLSREDSQSRKRSLRGRFSGVRSCALANQWRYMPQELPPWPAVYQGTHRWVNAGVYKNAVNDTQELLRHFEGRKGQPTAVCVDSRTHSTPKSEALYSCQSDASWREASLRRPAPAASQETSNGSTQA